MCSSDLKEHPNVLKSEVELLKNEVAVLKRVNKTQAEVMKAYKNEWDEERNAMKKEKKN